MRPETIKYIEENVGSIPMDPGLRRGFYELYPKGKGNKSKNKWMGLHQTEKFLHNKRNHQQNKKGNQPNERRYLQTISLIKG